MSMNYFNPKRTQPFIITLFMAIMAFKRVCKMMKKRLAMIHKKGHSHQITPFRLQLKKSNISVRDALRGRNVIQPAFVQSEIEAERNPFNRSALMQEIKTVRKITTKKKVAAYLDDYQIKLRLGRGAPATVDRLQKSLVITDVPKYPGSPTAQPKSPTHAKRKAVMVAPMKLSDAKEAHKDEVSDGGEEELGYEPGTSIYFGATIALQARHGGFLSYNSSQIKASAHKVLNNTRFVVKNSEDLTDVGVMKYGDALWLQAGHLDVLGAQYGSLVDQKRTIQPALVSCTRKNMFKAQQYGRWIVLNRNKPMQTLGKPVLHDDKIMLEQEWYFLASSSPYQSSMYKTLNNSDEAMTTKMDLFQPGDECSWKIHLVALPSDDKAGELQRQLLLQQAKESIDESAIMRYEKAPALLTSLHSKLPENLTDDAFINEQLHRKLHNNENQKYLMETYRNLGAKQFHSNYNPTKFLSHIYGPGSNIVRYKAFVLERQQSEDYFDRTNAKHHGDSYMSADDAQKTHIERLHDQYWSSAQQVLVDTKTWMGLPSAMAYYYKNDRLKKIRAASVLQKWIRKFLSSTFDFERAMKKVDATARNKLQEKLIAKRKLLIDHVSAIEAIEDRELKKAGKGGGHGHMHGSISIGMHAQPHTNSGTTQKHHRHKNSISTASVSSHVPHSSHGPHVTLQRSGTATRTNSLTIDSFSPLRESMTPVSPVQESSRRRSIVAMNRSKSVSEINDISQLVGAAGMMAIFNAAGLLPPTASAVGGGASERLGASGPGMIFQHTEVEFDEARGPSPEQRKSMMHQSHQTQSLPQLPVTSPTTHQAKTASTKVRPGGESLDARLNGPDSFATYLGFNAPTTTSSSKKFVPPGNVEEAARPQSAGPYNSTPVGIAYQEDLNNTMNTKNTTNSAQYSADYTAGTYSTTKSNRHHEHKSHSHHHHHRAEHQRPHTANAAVRATTGPSQQQEPMDADRLEAERLHEEHKARRREELHAQTLKDKRRLCRSASNAYGLPKDVFRGVKHEVDTKIGLKFLRAMSANPSIYDDIQVVKKRASSSHGRTRAPKSNIW